MRSHGEFYHKIGEGSIASNQTLRYVAKSSTTQEIWLGNIMNHGPRIPTNINIHTFANHLYFYTHTYVCKKKEKVNISPLIMCQTHFSSINIHFSHQTFL